MPSLLLPGWYFVAATLVLCVPGVAWLASFPEKHKSFPVFLADAVGLSLSLTALLALAAFFLGWRVSPAGLVGLYGMAGLLALVGLLRRPVGSRPDSDERELHPASSEGRAARLRVVLILGGFLLILGWRLYQARGLALPAWVDSVHHVLIGQVILERGGVPATLDPYLPVPFYYHFAFHLLAAVFSFWSGLGVDQAVLWIGQALNALVALSVYRLAIALWQDWRRAALAGLLVGFVTQMPAYYLTWGRYTLLTGLVLLPLAMAAALDIAQRGSPRSSIARLAVLTGGLLLSHYFASLLLALFLLILSIQVVIQDGKRGSLWRGNRWLPVLLGAAGGVLLAGGWVVHMWGYARDGVGVVAVTTPEAVETVYFPEYLPYLWRMLGPARNYALLPLALLGLFAAAVRPPLRAFMVWAGALALLSSPWGLRLSPFRPDHAVIVLFLPMALLVADLFFTLGEARPVGRTALTVRVALGSSILGLLGWGLWDTRNIVNPATVLADGADRKAMEWIAAHTPPEANFLINTAYWQGSVYRGVDGGWWITPLTGRRTLLPPVVYDWGDQAYKERVNTLAEKTSRLKTCTAEFWEVIQSAGLTHVYLVNGKGSLQPTALEDCPNLVPIYEEEGVFIYQVRR